MLLGADGHVLLKSPLCGPFGVFSFLPFQTDVSLSIPADLFQYSHVSSSFFFPLDFFGNNFGLTKSCKNGTEIPYNLYPEFHNVNLI